MKRFFLWCRRPYLRVQFVRPDALRLAQDAITSANNASCLAQRAMEFAESVARELAKTREEVLAYFCSSMEPEAQIVELNQLQNRARKDGEKA